jgi:hypothetical protein
MDLRDTVSAELPAPRDDEPASLRQDILDELADHLACSYNREVLRGAKPVEARRRVIERFGDPAAVACRLWLDAMKGKIMARRILIATCLVVTMASLSAAGVMWRQTAQAQRESARAVAEAVRLMAEQNQNAQAGQQEMLKQLREMSETVRSTKSLEWNPVTFKLTEETADGPSVAGAEVTLTEQQAGGGPGGGFWPAEVATRTTDRSGIADLGVVRPGDYTFHITRSWDQGSELAFGQLKIEPGSRIDRQVVCPKVPLGRVPVRVRLGWPADLAKENLTLYASFALNPIRRNELSWTISDQRPSDRPPGPGRRGMPRVATWQPATRTVLLGPATAMAQVRPSSDTPYVWTSTGDQARGLRAEFSSRDLRQIKEPSEAIEFEQGTYRLSGLLVLRPWPATDVKADRRSFEVVLTTDSVGLWVWDHPPAYEANDGPRAKDAPARKGARANGRGGRGQQGFFSLQQLGLHNLIVPWESLLQGPERFEAGPGRLNEWTIPLSDELLEAIRKRLKDAANVEKAE